MIRTSTVLRSGGLVLALAGAALTVQAVAPGRATPRPGTVAARTVDQGAVARLGATGDLGSVISGLQRRLRAQPRDVASWATLGLAYVEQARVSGDPSFYPKADEALAEGTRLDPRHAGVLAARAALAAARHDFSTSLRLADSSLALDPYSASAAAVRADALTELGRYPEALAAAEHADQLEPSVSTFARLSYAYELRGNLPRARALMQRAADAGGTPADVAFARTHLGLLARAAGDRAGAAAHFAAALRASAGYLPAMAAQASLAAAEGRTDQARQIYATVVERSPLASYVVAFGELDEALGRLPDARAQYAVVVATNAIAKANGVTVDLENALFEADHGDPVVAVATARTEWVRRHSIHVADALGWALHRAGRDAEALGYLRRATALGTRDATLLYHRGAVEAALGLRAAARSSLTTALHIDPAFSPLTAPRAAALLRTLEQTR